MADILFVGCVVEKEEGVEVDCESEHMPGLEDGQDEGSDG